MAEYRDTVLVEPADAGGFVVKMPRILQRAGLFVHHVSGSHYVLRHSDRAELRVTLPWPNRDLKRGTHILDRTGRLNHRRVFETSLNR
jgi:predicted RNA binding protein YcfA (HicA-like mRNA interferase family)